MEDFMSHQNFAIFSNTFEEYEPFINTNIFYWPNGMISLTENQRKLTGLPTSEKVGDKVAIIVGGRLKDNIKDPYLKQQITVFPMITHIAEIVEVYERPALGFRYTHGRNPDKSFMLPFEFLPQLKTLPTYLGRSFSKDNIQEIDKGIELGNCIQALIKNNEIVFTRAYYQNKAYYIQAEDTEEVYEIATNFPKYSKKQVGINNLLTYRELPDKASLQKIIHECHQRGLNGEQLILDLRTWRGKKYMKLKIVGEMFQALSIKLQEGVSTRLLMDYELPDLSLKEQDRFIIEIQHQLQQNKIQSSEGKEMISSKNTILYGPPGTGKTYSLIEKAVHIINPSFATEERTREEYEKIYRTYLEKKQIQFCTFHQSFSYEDFVEGLRSDTEVEGAPFTPQNGVFKDICELAKGRFKLSNSSSVDLENSTIYKISLGEANSVEGEKIYRDCIENNRITLGHGSDIDFTGKNNIHEISSTFEEAGEYVSSTVIKLLDNFKNNLQKGDIVIVSKGNLKFRAIAKVVGDYFYDEESDIRYSHFREVEWLFISNIGEEAQQLFNVPSTERKRFSQLSIYPFGEDQLNREALQRFLSTNQSTEEERFVLIIDEINRGNISKIFGELITLIEEDKRYDVDENGVVKGLEVTLPYSKDPFSVPKNVYLLGTMNTADRSISLMDTALRRRFNFEEMLPKPALLGEVDGIDVQRLLTKINQRIDYLYDRDHQIGHAYFIGKKSISELIEVMQRKVIPLLQEYFYDDWEKIELVLGGATASKETEDHYFLSKQTIHAHDLFNRTSKIQPKKVSYSLVQEPTMQALLHIYKEKSEAIHE